VFRLLTGSYAYTVHLWWWKFASPVRDGESVTVCGSRRDLPGQDVIRVSSFTAPRYRTRHRPHVQDLRPAVGVELHRPDHFHLALLRRA
jgi:hypothetical protein